MRIIDRVTKTIKSKIFLYSVKCIIWDYDGTLYKSDKIGEMLKNHFYIISKSYRKDLTVSKFDLKSKMLGSWSLAASYYSSIPEKKILDMVDKKSNKLDYINPDPKLVNFIESTQKKYSHIILTNACTDEVVLGLKKIGFKKNTFKKIFSRDINKVLKPNIKIYNQIQKYTNLKKENHLCIGDSLHCDIKPAREFGFKAIPIWELMETFNLKHDLFS